MQGYASTIVGSPLGGPSPASTTAGGKTMLGA